MDIYKQLESMNKVLSDRTASFALQRKEMAAHRTQVVQKSQAMNDVVLHLDNIKSTFETETKALSDAFQSGLTRICTALDSKPAQHHDMRDIY